jgi:hypothetical protein
MRLPGFTADEALHKTGELYKVTRILADLAGNRLIVPQWCLCSNCTEYGCVQWLCPCGPRRR